MVKSIVGAAAVVLGLIVASGLLTYASEETAQVMDQQPVIMTSGDTTLSTIRDKDDEPSTPSPDQPSKPEE